jgi:hypothetical protein
MFTGRDSTGRCLAVLPRSFRGWRRRNEAGKKRERPAERSKTARCWLDSPPTSAPTQYVLRSWRRPAEASVQILSFTPYIRIEGRTITARLKKMSREGGDEGEAETGRAPRADGDRKGLSPNRRFASWRRPGHPSNNVGLLRVLRPSRNNLFLKSCGKTSHRAASARTTCSSAA